MKKTCIPYRFLYILGVVLGFFFLLPHLYAQVNRPEIENVGPVEFISYQGPHSRIETVAQIRAIGYNLGLSVRGGALRPGELGRYFVIHSRGEEDEPKLDADIFGLGPNVGVDHITNLRRIIQGYLEGAYSYSQSDATLLARFITVYNAVYRGDIDYFDSRYNPHVIENITSDKAGLSIRYDEWPGQTLMLIPIGVGLGGQLSIIDTTTIIDPLVIEQLRQEPGMAIEERKDMVDLLERQADDATQEAAVIREAIRQEEVRIVEERQQAQQQQQQAQQEQQRIVEEIQQQPPQTPQQQQVLEQRQEAAVRQEQEAEQTLQELEEREEALEVMREEAEELEEFAEQKIEEAQEQRQLIAEDMQTIIQLPPQQDGVLGVAILVPASSVGRLVLIDTDTGKELKQSPINTVNTRTVTRVGNRLFAIAGENRGSAAIRIVEMSPSTLEMLKQGDNDISGESLLWANGQDLYAITSANGNLYMAKFNTDLVQQNRSTITVHPYASALFYNNTLLTQRTDGSAVLLNPGDLSEIK